MLAPFGSRTRGYARRIIVAISPVIFHTAPLQAAAGTASADVAPVATQRAGLPWIDPPTETATPPAASPPVTASAQSAGPPTPEGAPPETIYDVPRDDSSPSGEGERADLRDEANASVPTASRPSSVQFNLGLEWWFVRDKGIFGPTMRLGGRWVTAHLDWSLIRLWDDDPALKSRWLGSVAGLYLSVSPIHDRRVETHLGLGTDIHWLHGIHSEEAKVALAARASIHFWTGDALGVFGTARTYLASSSGLGLGETPNHTRNLPIMLTLGIEIREPREKNHSTTR